MTKDQDMVRGEWIGKKVRILSSTNSSLKDVEGVVVDETKFVLVVLTVVGEKRIPKSGCVFEFDGSVVRGDDVLVAPEERIKLKVKK